MLYTIPPIIRFIVVHFSLSLFLFIYVYNFVLIYVLFYSVYFMSLFCVLYICVFCVFVDRAFGCYTSINVCMLTKVMFPAANIDSLWLTNSSLRTHWVSTAVSYVKAHGLDGVNVDFEAAIDFTETEKRLGFTLLLQELSHSLKSVLPRAQVCLFLNLDVVIFSYFWLLVIWFYLN